MLGGSEIALNPRLSPDGHLLAFEAMVDGLSQIAVMKPESGNWSVLTRDRDRGPMLNHCWSADGALIYYDRYTDVPQGIFSVPVLGGDERLVLENAFSPEPLPDGSLLIVKTERRRTISIASLLARNRPRAGASVSARARVSTRRECGLFRTARRRWPGANRSVRRCLARLLFD